MGNKFSDDDQGICKNAFFDLLVSNRLTGRTTLNTCALDAAKWMSRFHAFMNRVTSKNYCEIVPETDNFPVVWRGMSKREVAKLQQFTDLRDLPNYIHFIHTLPGRYQYSEEIEVFKSLCYEFSVPIDDSSFSEFCRKPYEMRQYWPTEVWEGIRNSTNAFINELHLRLCSSKIRKKISKRRKAVEDNYQEMIKYVDKLFERYSRLLVLRIDLSYFKGFNIGIETLEKDLARFYANMRHNKLFQGKVGHINKIENGAEKGAHAHLILFFDASKRQGDFILARDIGEYWNNQITKGIGMCWNCNTAANKQDLQRKGRLGIGEIHESEIEKITNLKYIIRYFCKSEQFIKPITRKKMKLLRKGIPAKQTGRKRGAPRASQKSPKLSPAFARNPVCENIIYNPISPPPLPYGLLSYFPHLML